MSDDAAKKQLRTGRSLRINRKALPASRPLRLQSVRDLQAYFGRAIADSDGPLGAHCVHELWMRGEIGVSIDALLDRLWKSSADSVPDWLPMRHIDWLPQVYEIASHFKKTSKGRSNVYLVLLDYSDRSAGPFGIYVGMSSYTAAERFDQHKAGIRAAGSVLKRGLEPLTGPVMHLQKIKRADAARIEVELADALKEAGLLVQGGH